MPRPAAVLSGILLANWRVITLLLRDRRYVSRYTGAGKTVIDIVEIISAWNISTLDFISPTLWQAQWERTPAEDENWLFWIFNTEQLFPAAEHSRSWRSLRARGKNTMAVRSKTSILAHLYLGGKRVTDTVPWNVLAYKWSIKDSVLAMLSCCCCQQLQGLQAASVYICYWWIR